MAFKPACQFCQESHNVMECQCDDTPKVEVEDKPKADDSWERGCAPDDHYCGTDNPDDPYGGCGQW